MQRFFEKVESGYQINKSVLELCIFAKQNLISDPPFSRLDLISCRNVLIYLSAAAQKKIIPTFHYGLKPTGFLMLGISEAVGDFSELFSVVDKKYKIYARKMISSQLGIELITSNYALESPKAKIPDPNIYNNDLEMQKQVDRIILNQFTPAGVVINNNLEILQFRGQTNSYLELAPGKPSFNLLKMAKEELLLDLRSCIYQAKKEEVAVTRAGIQIRTENAVRLIKIDVIPFTLDGAEGEKLFLVLFRELSSLVTSDTAPASEIKFEQEQKINHEKETADLLHNELKTTKDYLQSIIEEQQSSNQDLRAANEEILSSNEELQSTNEELQTAKEEIQASNEELNTINDELQRRNIESNQVNNDLQNQN